MKYSKEYPVPGFSRLTVDLLGDTIPATGSYEVAVLPGALKALRPIACVATGAPLFQILIGISPLSAEVLVAVGTADNRPPVSYKIYELPDGLDFDIAHRLQATFWNWQITSLALNGVTLQQRITDQKGFSYAQEYISSLNRNAERLIDQLLVPTTPTMLEMVHPLVGSPFQPLVAQKQLLESLFGPAWFRTDVYKKTHHPAFRRWQIFDDLLQGRSGIPVDEMMLKDFVRAMLDNYFIIACTGGRLEEFAIGSFSGYGDSKVQKRIREVIQEPIGFFSVMTELAYASHHYASHHHVVPHEDAGLPDFEVVIPEWDLPLAVDCKHIMRDTSDKRIGALIAKVNKQVKALNIPCYGLAILDVSDKVDVPPVLSDEIPPVITHLKQMVQQSMSRHNSSVSGALLFWDDFAATLPVSGGNLVLAIRRRTDIVLHTTPKHALDRKIDPSSFGTATLLVALKAHEDPLPFGPFVIPF